MKSNVLKSAVRSIAVLASAAALGGLTQAVAGAPPSPPRHLGGLLNDYSPAHVNGAAVKGAPYEMRGRWSLDLQRYSRTATFSAALNMETTDAGAVSQDDPTTRGAHTHHITMTGPISYDDQRLPCQRPSEPADHLALRRQRPGTDHWKRQPSPLPGQAGTFQPAGLCRWRYGRNPRVLEHRVSTRRAGEHTLRTAAYSWRDHQVRLGR